MPRPLAALFVLIALPTCIVLAVLTPPGQVADEPAHIGRAAALIQGQFHGQRRIVTDAAGRSFAQSGVLADPVLDRVALWLVLRPEAKLTAADYARLRALPWSGTRRFSEIGTIAVYMPVFYLPGAIGLGLAEAARVDPYDAIIVGRLVSCACFVLLGFLALARARRGRAIMFCVLTCPMTLSLAASFNQDGLMIAASTLATALATHRSPRARGVATVLIGCIATVKLPYLPLAVLLLIQPGETLSRRIGRVLMVALPACAWTALMLASVAAPVERAPYPAGPLWPGPPGAVFHGTDALAQLRVLLAAPSLLVTLPFGTLLHDPWLLRQGIGVLGWVSLQLPEALYTAWMVAIPCAILADLLVPGDPAARPGAARWLGPLLLTGAAVLSVWGIYIAQYLTWSDVGLARVDGPSGRYFLPLVPMLALALPALGTPRLAALRRLATAVPVLAAASGLTILPMIVVAAYYLI